MKIKVFAVLKEYFEEDFTITQSIGTIDELKNELIGINPAIKNLLASCRFAINNTFIDNTIKFNQNDTIYIIPPSSGG